MRLADNLVEVMVAYLNDLVRQRPSSELLPPTTMAPEGDLQDCRTPRNALPPAFQDLRSPAASPRDMQGCRTPRNALPLTFQDLSRKIISLCVVNIYINSNNKMERKTFTVKIEPEEDLDYHLHYEENFEIKSEVDLPIKLEESLKGEVHDNEEPDCCPGPITDPPTKEELNDYQEPECCMSPKTFPPIKEELHTPWSSFGIGSHIFWGEDESDASYYVDKNVKTEMKFYDPSLELMICTPYYHTPENKSQTERVKVEKILKGEGDYARTRDIYFINENLKKEDKIQGNIAPHIEREENVNQKIVQSMLSQEDIVMDTEAEENVNRKIVLRMPSPEDIVSDMEAKENGDIVGLMERY
uniref:Uncharacterized protein n=1 Tax=Timema tahoe TaxID=61484 RepID=A0A7R9NZC2_9NEOP|nr:unnamed protein product [Timema tahoe]